MKRKWKKNQMIITALAVMIAVAGYINYADTRLQSADVSGTGEEKEQTAQTDTILEDIESLDYDITDETQEEAQLSDGETPGEAVLTGASTYMAEARISREQIRSQNKETLEGIINNSSLTENERQEAVASMVQMTDLVEKESAAEILLEAQGFSDIVVNLTGTTADVIVPRSELSDSERAQIEDIVARKTGVEAASIVITPMNSTAPEETGDETGEEINGETNGEANGETNGENSGEK